MSKTIFITGTSSGLGKAVAIYFAGQGWNVAAAMRTPKKETELNQLSQVRLITLDVTSGDSIKAAVRDAIAAWGKIDVVVNNAGIGNLGALELVTETEIDQQWATNVRGVIDVIRAFMPHFRANQAGMFINISSVMGLSTGFPLSSLYSMSKFALEGLTEALYYEMKPLNIDLRLIEPGGFATNFNRNRTFQRDPEIQAYDALTDKIEYALSHLDAVHLTPVQDVVDAVYAVASRKSNQFRTLVGTDANSMMEARQAVSIDTYLEAAAARFK